MTTIVLIPGAGGDSWYWHWVIPLLEARGFDVIAPDLPAADESATFDDYADAVVSAIGSRRDDDLVVVAQSLGGFTGVMVSERLPVRMLIFVSAMIPAFGESAGEWWSSTGQGEATARYAVSGGRDPSAPFDVDEIFFHDVAADVKAATFARGETPQSEGIFSSRWQATRWPAAEVRVIAGRNDRLFPLDFMQKISRDRLGIEPVVIDAGHLSALSAPDALATLIDEFTHSA
ncbi:alpha/beta fold hydrolase [Subtercola lobariae]|nr:alpha/beta fold hydrolase [Subtercola lobariae]